MLVYLINIALILLFGYIFLIKFESDKSKKLYCAVVALQWILVSGLRDWSVGADTMNYYRAFESVKSKSWSRLFLNLWEYIVHGADIKDPGYELVEKAFQIFCGDYQIYLIFIAALFMGAMAVWIYKNSNMPCFSFILFSTLFYSFYAVTGHRQTIATALIVFMGYECIKKRKPIRFAILAFIAFFIHKSSIVFVPFYFIANIPITLPYVIIALIVVATVVILGKPLYGAIAEWMGFGEGMIEYDVGGAETYATVLILMCVLVLATYPLYKKHRENAKHIFNITLLTLMSSLLVYQNQSFMRIQQYYSLFLMISFPEVLSCFEKRTRTLAYFGAIGVLILYLCMNSPYYSFFWQ